MPGMSQLTKLAGLVAEKGVFGTIQYLPKRFVERMRVREEERFDEAFQVHTRGIAQLKDLDFDSPHRLEGIRYEGAPIGQFRRIMARLGIRFEDYTFIDYGSGKGRALFLAAERPFKRIIGVEFAPMLHEDAVRNIATYRNPLQRCFKIDAICADAVTYQPPDGPLVCFFYSPFKPRVFDLVLTNLKNVLDARPRPALLLFFGRNPESVALFERRWPDTATLPLPYDVMSRGNHKMWVTRVG
jgi:SAM-dependent methyltransferase